MKKYFPNQLLPHTSWIMQPRGDNCDDLLKELLQYLPGTNFSLQDFVAVDEEEILDFLDDYGAKMKPKKTRCNYLPEAGSVAPP